MIKTMIKKILTLILFPMVFALGTKAQTGTLTGTVIDENTGETLPGVNITIPELGRGTAAQADGEYAIENIEYGSYRGYSAGYQ